MGVHENGGKYPGTQADKDTMTPTRQALGIPGQYQLSYLFRFFSRPHIVTSISQSTTFFSILPFIPTVFPLSHRQSLYSLLAQKLDTAYPTVHSPPCSSDSRIHPHHIHTQHNVHWIAVSCTNYNNRYAAVILPVPRNPKTFLLRIEPLGIWHCTLPHTHAHTTEFSAWSSARFVHRTAIAPLRNTPTVGMMASGNIENIYITRR